MTFNRQFDPDRDTMDALVEVLYALLVEEPGEPPLPPAETCLQPEPE